MKNTKGFTYLILPHERNQKKAGLYNYHGLMIKIFSCTELYFTLPSYTLQYSTLTYSSLLNSSTVSWGSFFTHTHAHAHAHTHTHTVYNDGCWLCLSWNRPIIWLVSGSEICIWLIKYRLCVWYISCTSPLTRWRQDSIGFVWMVVMCLLNGMMLHRLVSAVQ